MKRYCPTIPFAAALLLSTLGCPKQDEPAAPATGSYKLDSATIAISGTFAGNVITPSGTVAGPYATRTHGVFTNVHP